MVGGIMKSWKVHLVKGHYPFMVCGIKAPFITQATKDPNKVTCGNCQRVMDKGKPRGYTAEELGIK